MATATKFTNRSAAIRNYLSKHPNAKPREVAEKLAAKGVKVSNTYVSVVKSKMTGEQGRPAIRTATPATNPADQLVSIDDLLRTKQFVDTFGGDVTAATESLKAFAKLKS